MREYVLHQAVARQMTFAGSPIARAISNWRNRRVIRQLEENDDFMLRDMGITRGDLRRAASLPLSASRTLWPIN
jgi:uncharacterized protein YjiS (DUF1127 family)